MTTKPTTSSSRGTARTEARTDTRVDRRASASSDRSSDRSSPLAGLRIDERVSKLRDRLESRADSRAAAELRSIVREARGHVKGWSPDRVSQDTAKRYDRALQTMREDDLRPEDAANKRTFQFNRAAVVHDARATIRDGLRDLDKARRAGDLRGAAMAFNEVRSGLDTLRRYPPSTGSREEDLKRTSVYQGPARADAERSNGKRGSLAGLPSDWRDRFQERVRDGDRAAVAVLALTGARPAEIRGVKVRQSGDQVSITIGGAKHDADRGVKSRTLEFSRDELAVTAAGRDLVDWIGNRECRTVTYAGSLSAFRERVARAADRAGLPDATAYSYRHAAARELKQAGTDRSEIAERLGHRSCRSQSVYG